MRTLQQHRMSLRSLNHHWHVVFFKCSLTDRQTVRLWYGSAERYCKESWNFNWEHSACWWDIVWVNVNHSHCELFVSALLNFMLFLFLYLLHVCVILCGQCSSSNKLVHIAINRPITAVLHNKCVTLAMITIKVAFIIGFAWLVEPHTIRNFWMTSSRRYAALSSGQAEVRTFNICGDGPGRSVNHCSCVLYRRRPNGEIVDNFCC